MSVIGVDKGIPLPKGGPGAPRKYPFREMAVGDSFFVPGTKANTIRTATRHHRPMVFVVRACDEHGIAGVRCWRVS